MKFRIIFIIMAIVITSVIGHYHLLGPDNWVYSAIGFSTGFGFYLIGYRIDTNS